MILDKGQGMVNILNKTPIEYVIWGNHEHDLGKSQQTLVVSTQNFLRFLLIALIRPKIQLTKMFVTSQMFGDLFLLGLIWQYSSDHKTYNKGRFKAYLQQ